MSYNKFLGSVIPLCILPKPVHPSVSRNAWGTADDKCGVSGGICARRLEAIVARISSPPALGDTILWLTSAPAPHLWQLPSKPP